MELGLSNPLKDDWFLASLLKGVKRGKGTCNSKAPLTPDHLLKIRAVLNPHNVADNQFWVALLSCFFGLLRISNVTVGSELVWDTDRILRRADVAVTQTGTVFSLRWSKNNQFMERIVEVPLPVLPDHTLCPTTAICRFLTQAGDLPATLPFLSYKVESRPPGYKVLTHTSFRNKLRALLQRSGISNVHYNTHSLRRGGATWLLSAGVPVAAIKVLGDWKSDCVFRYLCPSVHDKMNIVQKAASTL
jgi:hypothetical protein